MLHHSSDANTKLYINVFMNISLSNLKKVVKTMAPKKLLKFVKILKIEMTQKLLTFGNYRILHYIEYLLREK